MLRYDADSFPQGGQAVFPDIPAAELHGAGGNVVKAGNQADQRRLAAAGAADDPDGLPGRGGEGNMLKARVAGRTVADGDVLKGQADRTFRQKGFAVFLGGRGQQDVIDTPGTGGGLGQRNDQVGQFDQLHQDLSHIVVQGDQLTLGQPAAVHLQRAGMDQEEDAGIQGQEGHRVHGGRQPACEQLDLRQQPVQAGKAFRLVFLLYEGADHAHAGEVFPRGGGDAVQPFADLLLQGHRAKDDAEDNQEQGQDDAAEDQRTTRVNGAGHDERAEDHEGRAQQQAQAEVDPRLHLVDVPGDPGDQGGGTETVQIRVGKGLDMGKEVMPERCGEADGRARGEILGGERGSQAEQRHQDKLEDTPPDHGQSLLPQAFIHQTRDDQRHDQLKNRFQQLKGRPEDAFLPVLLQSAPESFHRHDSH